MHAFKPHILYRCDGNKNNEMWYMHMIDACKFSNPMPWDNAVVIYAVMLLHICCFMLYNSVKLFLLYKSDVRYNVYTLDKY